MTIKSIWAVFRIFVLLSGVAYSNPASAGTLYQTGFEAPAFQLGNLTGQGGWLTGYSPSVDAGQVVSFSAGQVVQITGSELALASSNFYTSYFYQPLQNYSPLAMQTPVISVSADFWLTVGPISHTNWLFAFLILSDQNGVAFETIGIDNNGNVFGQNFATQNQTTTAPGKGTNSFHTLRTDLDFTSSHMTFFMDGTPFGSMPFNTSSSNQLGSVGLILQGGDPVDATMLADNLSVVASPRISRVFHAASYEAVVKAEPSLISFYTFNNMSANDSVGTNNGSLAGTTAFVPSFDGGTNLAFGLIGSGWATFGREPAFDFSGGTGTVEVWLRADWNSVGYNPNIFADRDDGVTRVNYSIHMTSGEDAISYWNGTAAPEIFLPAYASTNWHHLGVIFNLANWTVVWDGQNLGTNALATGGASSTFQIGSSNPTGTELWIGDLDEVALYRGALDPAEISYHYQAAYLVPPQLGASISGGNALLSWTNSGSGNWILEATAQLPASGWTPVATNSSPVMVPLTGTSHFFRLRGY